MAKDKALGLRIEEKLKDAMERAAKDDHRSLASLIEKVMSDWLKEKGYLKD